MAKFESNKFSPGTPGHHRRQFGIRRVRGSNRLELRFLTEFLFWPMHELVYIICVFQPELVLPVTESNILKFLTGRPKFYGIDTSDSSTEDV
jgi:hypothetical protein